MSEPRTDEVEGIVEEFNELWRKAHNIEGNNGREAIFTLNYGLDKLSPWLRTTLQTQADKVKREREKVINEVVLEMEVECDLINQHTVYPRKSEYIRTMKWKEKLLNVVTKPQDHTPDRPLNHERD